MEGMRLPDVLPCTRAPLVLAPFPLAGWQFLSPMASFLSRRTRSGSPARALSPRNGGGGSYELSYAQHLTSSSAPSWDLEEVDPGWRSCLEWLKRGNSYMEMEAANLRWHSRSVLP